MAFEPGTWEIAVLALLREAPMHPYQMQRLLHLRHKDEILDLKRGSLYHAIRRLAQSGLIDVEKTDRDGRRPERTTYRITPAGSIALLDVLRKIVARPGRESSECMAAMSFLVHIDPGEACMLLEERARNLKAEIDRTAAALADATARVARINLIESEYRWSCSGPNVPGCGHWKGRFGKGNSRGICGRFCGRQQPAAKRPANGGSER